MPKYNITAEFGLTTEMDADFYGHDFDGGQVKYEEFENNSNFGSTAVEVSGGNITFVVDAEDEAHAEEMASEVIFDGQEHEDGNGYTWLVEDVSIDVEQQEMSLTEAVQAIRDWLRMAEESQIPASIREALDVVMERIATL